MCIDHVSDSYHRVGENQSSNNIYTLAERLLDVNAREESVFFISKNNYNHVMIYGMSMHFLISDTKCGGKKREANELNIGLEGKVMGSRHIEYMYNYQ